MRYHRQVVVKGSTVTPGVTVITRTRLLTVRRWPGEDGPCRRGVTRPEFHGTGSAGVRPDAAGRVLKEISSVTRRPL
ncbi:hypothetical protein GCM10022252_70110 [Streptosporangium oxazolinicum]|uniref:Uncharacterized protein n=1 Tax=Streptosporangium oxazolinicum TaxID=909287 RepID=A0ABP8BIU4_9ACTN